MKVLTLFRIEDISAFWGRITKQCIGWVTSIQLAYQSLPDEMKTALTSYMTAISVVLLVLSFIGHNESHKETGGSGKEQEAP